MVDWLKNLFNGHEPEQLHELSLEEIRARADQIAREAGLSGAVEAYRLLDAGELEGTLLEVELEKLRFLEQAPTDKVA